MPSSASQRHRNGAPRKTGGLPEANQEVYAEAFLEQIEADDDFDRLIASRPDVLRKLADEALAEIKAGRTSPLTEADFEVDRVA